MPRAPRVFVDGACYHVVGRIARGEMVFVDRGEAAHFVDVVRGVKKRDGLTVFAWCLMGNHYHVALRIARVPLWREQDDAAYHQERLALEQRLAEAEVGGLRSRKV